MNQRAVIYARTSTVDQHTQNQVYDLEQLAQQRGLEIIHIYEDQVSGTRARRPGLDQLLADARKGKFDVLLVWACDRLARSVSHFLQVLDELASSEHRVHQLSRTARHHGTLGSRRGGDHLRHRGTRTIADRREGSCRAAAGETGRPAAGPSPAGRRPPSHSARPGTRPEHQPVGEAARHCRNQYPPAATPGFTGPAKNPRSAPASER